MLITLQDEYEEIDTVYTEEKKQLNELEERFKTLQTEYDQIMEERRVAREKREAAERELQMCVGAATTIQVRVQIDFFLSYSERKKFVLNPLLKSFRSICSITFALEVYNIFTCNVFFRHSGGPSKYARHSKARKRRERARKAKSNLSSMGTYGIFIVCLFQELLRSNISNNYLC